MPDFGVSEKKQEDLKKEMARLGIKEKDLTEKFIKSSGPGGRKRDTSSSGVYLKHEPTGTEVSCDAERTQALNRFFARRRLAEKISEHILGERSRKRKEIERIRRNKRKRSKRAKEKMLRAKKIRGEKKQMRKKPEVPPDETT